MECILCVKNLSYCHLETLRTYFQTMISNQSIPIVPFLYNSIF